MPRFGSDADRRIALTIESWQQTATDEVDTIGGWRDAPSWKLQAYFADPACTLPKPFRSETHAIVKYLTLHHPLLGSPMPFVEVYTAIETWYRDKGPAFVPPQSALLNLLEVAGCMLSCLWAVIDNRIVSQEWLPASEAVERAAEQGLADLTLPALSKHKAAFLTRPAAGRHKLEVEWYSFSTWLSRRRTAERDDPADIERRKKEVRRGRD